MKYWEANNIKSLGVIIGVNGELSQVGMYELSNSTEIIWDGSLLMGAKLGAFLTIKQDDVKIISTVSSEQVTDQQNKVNSTEFDNRYSKNSINRIIFLKTQGVIINDEFSLTSKYVPMVGNEVTLTEKEDLNKIYSIKNTEEKDAIIIGRSIRDGEKVPMPINGIFASHIGIFGNTGSGKSNTLHKLYLELFRTSYYDQIVKKSKFFVIDFNGEYTGEKQFGVNKIDKEVFYIGKKDEKKIPISKSYFLKIEILKILFDAKPGIQVPFLKSSIKKFKNINNGNEFARMECGLLKALLKDIKKGYAGSIIDWVDITESIIGNSEYTEIIRNIGNYQKFGNTKIFDENNRIIFNEGILTKYGKEMFFDLFGSLSKKYDELSEVLKLKSFLNFQKIYESLFSKNVEFINPIIKRIDSSLDDLNNIIRLNDDITSPFKSLNIISLLHANQEIKRIIPMLVSKMIYDYHKSESYINGVNSTVHLIIDEAHNILNSLNDNMNDHWKDYRLSVFEEIIKEGRKFGFYLTLSSQRPYDISPTIISQIHNFFIHKIVNDKDLRMLENTMPTLDKSSYNSISKLGTGECIATGNVFKIPTIIKVNKEKQIRPKSDNIVLTDLWNSN